MALFLSTTNATPSLAQTHLSPCAWMDGGAESTTEIQTTDLAGRIGSTREAFEGIYGSPKDADTAFPEYVIEGCGSVFVTYDEAGFAVDINVYAPRDPNRGLQEADDADWPSAPAFTVAANFAPLDLQCGDLGIVPDPYGYAIRECSSAALLDQVPTASWDYADASPSYGSFVIFAQSNGAEGYSSVRISLRFDGGDFPTS